MKGPLENLTEKLVEQFAANAEAIERNPRLSSVVIFKTRCLAERHLIVASMRAALSWKREMQRVREGREES